MARHAIVEGLYDLLVSKELRDQLDEKSTEAWFLELDDVDAEIAPHLIVAQLIPHLLAAFQKLERTDRRAKQVRLANAIIAMLTDLSPRSGVHEGDSFEAPFTRLLAAVPPNPTLGQAKAPQRPGIPLNGSDLLVNGRRELRVGSELKKELASADQVDLLCAFLKFSGLRVLKDDLQSFLDRRPGGLRVITSTYMGATEARALTELKEMGAEIKVTYNTQTTRLHAKAWLFHRRTGFSTAFIGSSNLSFAALLDGLEWNVRVSAVDRVWIR